MLQNANVYLQSLVIPPFCTGSQYNLVSKKINNNSSWIPNLIDFLYKMVVWRQIEGKRLKIIFWDKVPF